MDALTLVLQLFFRSFVVLLPLVVGGLAFRRLTKSKSSNAWIYAVTCLFAAVTTAGLLPWAVGLSTSSWIFFVLAAFCPAVWFAVTTVCDVSRHGSYETEIDDVASILFKAHRKTPAAPLVLNNPVVVEPAVDIPVPLFSHRGVANIDAPSAPAPTEKTSEEAGSQLNEKVEEEVTPALGDKSVLDVAREMRRNKSSEDRRPKLLPSPSMSELPFIKSSGTA